MSVAIFLDTNIIKKNYNMEGVDFTNLFHMVEEFSEEVDYSLFITKMNKYEILRHYKESINIVINKYTGFFNDIKKLIPSGNVDSLDIHPRTFKKELLDEYAKKIEWIFTTIKPSESATKKAVNRMYLNKMPCKENKEQIKDSIIWETIEEYGCTHPEVHVFFISENHKDFAIKNPEPKETTEYVLHEDFNNLNGRIKFYTSIKDFLTNGVRYLKTHIFEHQDRDEILAQIKEFIHWYYPNNIRSEIESFFSDNEFGSEYFCGWGTDPYLKTIHDIRLSEDINVVTTDDYFIIPCQFDAEFGFYVQTNSPVYERGDENEYITSDLQLIELHFDFEVVYNKKNQAVDKIESINIDVL